MCSPLSLPKELMVFVSHEFENLYNDCVLQNIIGRKKLMPQNLLAARDKRNETDSEKLWQWSYDRDLVTWSHEMRGKWEEGVCSPRYCAKILRWKRYLCRLCMSQMRIMERIFNVFRTGANGRWAFVASSVCQVENFLPSLYSFPLLSSYERNRLALTEA